jgi:hypothetical protein
MASRRGGRRRGGESRERDPREGPEAVDAEGAPEASDASGVEGARAPAIPSGAGGREGIEPPFGLVNWALAIAGVVLLVFGFILLSRANAQGDNMPAHVSPFVILGSYLMIFVAIVLRVPVSGRRDRHRMEERGSMSDGGQS